MFRNGARIGAARGPAAGGLLQAAPQAPRDVDGEVSRKPSALGVVRKGLRLRSRGTLRPTRQPDRDRNQLQLQRQRMQSMFRGARGQLNGQSQVPRRTGRPGVAQCCADHGGIQCAQHSMLSVNQPTCGLAPPNLMSIWRQGARRLAPALTREAGLASMSRKAPARARAAVRDGPPPDPADAAGNRLQFCESPYLLQHAQNPCVNTPSHRCCGVLQASAPSCCPPPLAAASARTCMCMRCACHAHAS